MTKWQMIVYGFVGVVLAAVVAGSCYVGYVGVQTVRAATFLSQPIANGPDGKVFTYGDVLRDMAVATIQQAVKQSQAQQPSSDPEPATKPTPPVK